MKRGIGRAAWVQDDSLTELLNAIAPNISNLNPILGVNLAFERRGCTEESIKFILFMQTSHDHRLGAPQEYPWHIDELGSIGSIRWCPAGHRSLANLIHGNGVTGCTTHQTACHSTSQPHFSRESTHWLIALAVASCSFSMSFPSFRL